MQPYSTYISRASCSIDPPVRQGQEKMEGISNQNRTPHCPHPNIHLQRDRHAGPTCHRQTSPHHFGTLGETSRSDNIRATVAPGPTNSGAHPSARPARATWTGPDRGGACLARTISEEESDKSKFVWFALPLPPVGARQPSSSPPIRSAAATQICAATIELDRRKGGNVLAFAWTTWFPLLDRARRVGLRERLERKRGTDRSQPCLLPDLCRESQLQRPLIRYSAAKLCFLYTRN